MLTFQAGQIAKMDELVRGRFAEQLAQHARGYAPKLCEVAGAEAVLRAANLAIARAIAAGWSDQLLVRFYLELMITLGADFPRDPQYPWVQARLQPSQLETPHTRACRLHQDVMDYLARVAGPQQCHAREALRRLVQAGAHEWQTAAGGSGAALHDCLGRLYPEKAAVCSLAQVEALAAQAREQAVAGGLPADRGTWLLGSLMLAFGIGVCRDPFYPWVAAVLDDPRIVDPQARVQRLWQKVGTYATSAAQYLQAA
jgi:hypothetical protein